MPVGVKARSAQSARLCSRPIAVPSEEVPWEQARSTGPTPPGSPSRSLRPRSRTAAVPDGVAHGSDELRRNPRARRRTDGRPAARRAPGRQRRQPVDTRVARRRSSRPAASTPRTRSASRARRRGHGCRRTTRASATGWSRCSTRSSFRRAAFIGASYGAGVFLRLATVAPKRIDRAVLVVPAGMTAVPIRSMLSLAAGYLSYRVVQRPGDRRSHRATAGRTRTRPADDRVDRARLRRDAARYRDAANGDARGAGGAHGTRDGVRGRTRPALSAGPRPSPSAGAVQQPRGGRDATRMPPHPRSCVRGSAVRADRALPCARHAGARPPADARHLAAVACQRSKCAAWAAVYAPGR